MNLILGISNICKRSGMAFSLMPHFNITEEIFLLQLRSLIHRKFNLIKTIKQSGNHLALAASLFHR